MKSTVSPEAAEIVFKLAWSNNVSPEERRHRIEGHILGELRTPTSDLSAMRQQMFPETLPSMDEMIVAFKQKLYDKLIRQFEGWVWSGDGYLNTNFCSLEEWNATIGEEEQL